MLKTIIRKELLETFTSFRFALALILVVILFSTSAVIFNRKYNTRLEDYRRSVNSSLEELQRASTNLSQVARLDQRLYMKPFALEFITDGGEDKIWNAWNLSAFYLGIPSGAQSGNWLLRSFDPLDLQFLIGVILSFIALILTFDGITGEKGDGTLKLMLSNHVSRAAVVLSKFLASFTAISLTLLIGFLLALIIILSNRNLALVGQDGWKILAFCVISLIYLSLFLLLGLLISSLTRNSVTSFALCMFVWLVLVVIAPLVGSLLAPHFRPVHSWDETQKQVFAAQRQIWESAPEGAGSYTGSPTYSKMRERVELINRLTESDNQIKLDYLRKLIAQAQGAAALSSYSPATIFRSSAETLAGSGLGHFARFVEQGIAYQNELLRFVKAKDERDPESFHYVQAWHAEAFSQKPVPFGEIPQFEDKPKALGETLQLLAGGSGYLIFLNVLFFAAGFVAFIRYDVR